MRDLCRRGSDTAVAHAFLHGSKSKFHPENTRSVPHATALAFAFGSTVLNEDFGYSSKKESHPKASYYIKLSVSGQGKTFNTTYAEGDAGDTMQIPVQGLLYLVP